MMMAFITACAAITPVGALGGGGGGGKLLYTELTITLYYMYNCTYCTVHIGHP